MRRTLWALLAASAALALAIPTAQAGAGAHPTGAAVNRSIAPARTPAEVRRGQARTAQTPAFLPSAVECVAHGAPRNLNLDCDDPVAPNNEPHVIVDPRDPRHLVASSNDYDSNGDEFYTTFDGGRSWTTGDMSLESADHTGSDPVTAFDPKHHTVIHASLNYVIRPDGQAENGDVVVSVSTDGGGTWGEPVVVDRGVGADLDPLQLFNDKEWVATDTNPRSRFYGRTYLTWSKFKSTDGNYLESPIFEAHSDNGGRSWSVPQEISGSSARYCTFQVDGAAGECDEDQASTIAIARDGTVFVAFINEQHQRAWEPGEQFENQYLVVRSPNGGKAWSKPVHVVDMEDGSLDYPLNADGSQTITGMQMRLWSVGNLAIDPHSGRLYLVFSDNRAGVHDVANPVTHTQAYVMRSADGASWEGPRAVAPSKRDQWFPFVAVNPRNGTIGVLYNDRISRDEYVASLATGTFARRSRVVLSSEPSNANDAIVFQAGVPDCPKCTLFHGDYIGLDYGRDGTANAVWTDMRRVVSSSGDTGHTENIFYSRH
jgi:hypothetical protein